MQRSQEQTSGRHGRPRLPECVAATLAPTPGTDLVPRGWCEKVVVPWLAELTTDAPLREASAALAGLEAAHVSLKRDAIEITKARRHLEVRWGELLGPAPRGRNQHSEPSRACDGSLPRMERTRLRQLAAAKARVLRALSIATDADEISQAALLRVARGEQLQPLMSSATSEWGTPRALFEALDAEFGFTIDVCATADLAKCKRFYSPEDDGLTQKWVGTCWMNPPYGAEIHAWIEKAATSAAEGATVVCLIPARTDTAWWWEYVRLAEVRFLRGRLRFDGAAAGAPFPSAVAIFAPSATPQTLYWDADKMLHGKVRARSETLDG